MNGLTAFGALGTVNAFGSSVEPDHARVAATGNPHLTEKVAGPKVPDAAASIYTRSRRPAVQSAHMEALPLAIEDAPSSVPPTPGRTPAVQSAHMEALPLAIEYAPSSVPRGAKFDRLA